LLLPFRVFYYESDTELLQEDNSNCIIIWSNWWMACWWSL